MKTHADEIRELLLEAARAIEDREVCVSDWEERDGLAWRCRRYAEDLSRPTEDDGGGDQ
jgi:Lon protease-like protein